MRGHGCDLCGCFTNSKDLLTGELGSSSKICVTSIVDGNEVTGMEAERVSDMKDEEVKAIIEPQIIQRVS